MRRVYLDQNKWIDLARAATGRAEGGRFVEALAAARDAVAAGTAVFPSTFTATGRQASVAAIDLGTTWLM